MINYTFKIYTKYKASGLRFVYITKYNFYPQPTNTTISLTPMASTTTILIENPYIGARLYTGVPYTGENVNNIAL